MCHVATWLLDEFEIGTHRHHGPMFKKWANLVSQRIPGIIISTYHTYEAHKPHRYKCTTESCGTIYQRHTKKGIDIQRFVKLAFCLPFLTLLMK